MSEPREAKRSPTFYRIRVLPIILLFVFRFRFNVDTTLGRVQCSISERLVSILMVYLVLALICRSFPPLSFNPFIPISNHQEAFPESLHHAERSSHCIVCSLFPQYLMRIYTHEVEDGTQRATFYQAYRSARNNKYGVCSLARPNDVDTRDAQFNQLKPC